MIRVVDTTLASFSLDHLPYCEAPACYRFNVETAGSWI